MTLFLFSGIDKVSWNFQNALGTLPAFGTYLVLNDDIAGDGRYLKAIYDMLFLLGWP